MIGHDASDDNAPRPLYVRCHPETKTPIGDDWPSLATADRSEVDAWVSEGFNVGTILGPASGWIDAESDDEEASRLAERMFGEFFTPTWISRRSKHRLFKWDDRLAALKASAVLDGIEFRLGASGAAAQSIIPPSVADGVRREWLPGLSPDDVDVQPLPESVVLRLLELAKEKPPCESNGTLWVAGGGFYNRRSSILGSLRNIGLDANCLEECIRAIERHHFAPPSTPADARRRESNIRRQVRDYARLGASDIDLHDGTVERLAFDLLEGMSKRKVDVDEPVGDEDEPVDDERPDDPGPVPPHLLNPGGLMGAVIDHNLRTAHRPRPELALAGALALLSTITGRRIETETGLRTNLYIIGVSPSGGGKDHSRQINKAILASSPAGQKLITYGDVASAQGIDRAVRDCLTPLLQIDECHKVFAASGGKDAAAYLAKIPEILKELYTSSRGVFGVSARAADRRRKDDDPDPPIAAPHLTLFGTTIAEKLYASLDYQHLSDGLFGRAIVFEDSGFVRQRIAPQIQIPAEITDTVADWLEWRPTGGNVAWEGGYADAWAFTAEAWEIMSAYAGECDTAAETAPSDAVSAAWLRAWERAAKLALIQAGSVHGPSHGKVDAAEAEWGVALGRHLVQRMLFHVGEHSARTKGESDLKKIVRHIRERGKPQTRGHLCRLTGLSSREVHQIAETGVDRGDLVRVPTRRKDSVAYALPGMAEV